MLGRTFRHGAGHRNEFDLAPFFTKLEVFGTWIDGSIFAWGWGALQSLDKYNHEMHI